MEPKIIKNFLEPEQFEDIKKMFYLPTFPWYLDRILEKNEEKQFTHSFFLREKRNSEFFSFLSPFLKKLNMFILVKAKANWTKIPSKENTMVIFDTHELHTGSTCTDKAHRIVLNFNYIEGVKEDVQKG